MKMTNRWNRFIYNLWAPVYDATVDHAFQPGRRRALTLLSPQPGEWVCLPGIGTGCDLPLLPAGTRALGVDLSASMLSRARARLPLPGTSITLVLGDAQLLPFRPSSFDAAVLDLVLSVVPDPAACFRSTLCALKSGGRLVIFDKFLPETSRPTLLRRLVNIFSTLFGTDINRRLGDIVTDTDCTILLDEPSIMEGMYRVILLRKGN